MVVAAARAGVVRVTDEHIPLLSEFYRNTWDAGATDERVRRARREAAAQNAAAPGEDVPTFLFVDGGRAVGHVTTIPIRLHDGRDERPAHWLKGLMVLPECRNGPIGFLVLRHAVSELGCALGFVVQPEARKLFSALKFDDLGAMPNRILPLRPAAMIRSIDLDRVPLPLPASLRRVADAVRSSRMIAGAAGAGVRALTRIRSLGAAGAEAAPDHELDAGEVDTVWQRMRPGVAAAPARSGVSLRHRYPDSPDGLYNTITVRERGAVAGAAFVRAPAAGGDPRLGGVRVATLSDVVAPLKRRDVMLGLLRGAEARARELGADALLCSATHPTLLDLLGRRGYLRVPANVHLMLRDPDGTLPKRLSDWWLMRGDSNADEVF